MNRIDLKAKIIYLLKGQKTWGHACNKIQDTAEKVLTKEEYNNFLAKSYKDFQLTEGMDCVIFNGQMFDWKVFDSKKINIISAFLDYFNNLELVKILGGI